MYDQWHSFHRTSHTSVVALPFRLEELIAGWEGLRSAMRRSVPPEFSRDEWAYLMAFLSREQLNRPFQRAFGCPSELDQSPSSLFRPRGVVAVWLPNNVSLLGPLTLILLTLTGNRILLKGGTRAADLTGAFLEFARSHLAEGLMRDVLHGKVQYDVFERTDARQKEMVDQADVRIVFGSDAAAAAIHGAADPARGKAFSFIDRQSQAWVDPEVASDEVLSDIIRVFAIYGTAGCTSPQRVVLLEATARRAIEVRQRMLVLWPVVMRAAPPVHVASNNTMAGQWAAARGWDVAVTPQRHAVIGVGPIDLERIEANMFLAVSPATLKEAIAHLPGNMQTLGHAFTPGSHLRCLEIAAQTGVKRLVPIARMHHFGPLWDGEDYWKQCFEEVEVEM